MPRVAGHFCLVYLVNIFADLQIAQFLWGIAREARNHFFAQQKKLAH
jgi:hypothetical protein